MTKMYDSPGVHWLQDQRSKVYNFPPYLECIPKVTDFAFERLGGFIKSSRDNVCHFFFSFGTMSTVTQDLWDLARREKRTFAGSTSSLSGMLSHVYFLLSGDKDVNTDNLSRNFGKEVRCLLCAYNTGSDILVNNLQPRNFTMGQRMPASVLMNHNDGVYAIDSDSDKEQYSDKNILTWMVTFIDFILVRFC